MIEFWAVLAALVGVVAVLVIVVVRNAAPTGQVPHDDRSRLRECFRRGSLGDVPPFVLLEAMRERRATGRLTLRSDGQPPISLYYLFGHLFHAVSGVEEGEQVVLHALNLSTGDFEFTPTMRLPEEESVSTPLWELFDKRAGRHILRDGSIESRAERPSRSDPRLPLTMRRGSLTEMPVASLLASLEQERASGKLTIEGNNGPATLYFINGHLYHAVDDGAVGDEAVIRALNRTSGAFDFDPRARLPADDTVASTIPDLVARAGEQGSHQSTLSTSSPSLPLPDRGSLGGVPVSSVLEALSRASASGRLMLFDDGRPPSVLYFLHGQLYHAFGDGAVGDEAVIRALRRSTGEYEFHAAAWLPDQSSVISSLPQLIAGSR